MNAVKDYDIPERLPGAPALNGTSDREYVSKRKYTSQLLAGRKCTMLAFRRKHSCQRVIAAEEFSGLEAEAE